MTKVERAVLIILPLLGIIYLLPLAFLGVLGFLDRNPPAVFLQAAILIMLFLVFLIALLMGKLKTRRSAWGFFATVILLAFMFNTLYNIIVWDAVLY